MPITPPRNFRFNAPEHQLVSDTKQRVFGCLPWTRSQKRLHINYPPYLTHKVLTRIVPGYIGEFEIIDDHRSGKIVVQLNGRLNKTGVISPRFNIQHTQIESWVNLLLPSRGFGIIILVRCVFLTSIPLLIYVTDHFVWYP